MSSSTVASFLSSSTAVSFLSSSTVASFFSSSTAISFLSSCTVTLEEFKRSSQFASVEPLPLFISSFSSVVAGSSMTIVSLSFPTSTSFPSFSASSASFLKVADSAEGSAFISVVVLPTTVSSPEDISSFEDSPPP